jgi:hypothetical protein
MELGVSELLIVVITVALVLIRPRQVAPHERSGVKNHKLSPGLREQFE